MDLFGQIIFVLFLQSSENTHYQQSDDQILLIFVQLITKVDVWMIITHEFATSSMRSRV